MNKTATILVTVLLTAVVASVTLLAYAGKNADGVMTFLASTILPTVVALFAGREANKAKEAAQQTVTNTNSRMAELIRVIEGQGKPIPEGYDDIIPTPAAAPDDATDSDVPEGYARTETGALVRLP